MLTSSLSLRSLTLPLRAFTFFFDVFFFKELLVGNFDLGVLIDVSTSLRSLRLFLRDLGFFLVPFFIFFTDFLSEIKSNSGRPLLDKDDRRDGGLCKVD